MLYLTGAKNPVIADDLAAGTMGLLLTPATGYALDGVKVWAMDNGAFTNRYPGDDAYLAKLAKLEDHKDRCLRSIEERATGSPLDGRQQGYPNQLRADRVVTKKGKATE